MLRDNARMAETLDPQFAQLLERIGQKLEEHSISERQASIEVTGKPDFIRELRRPRRKRMPDAAALQRLADLLQTSAEWLTGRTDDAAPPATVRTEVRAATVADVQRPFGGFAPQAKPVPLLGSAMGGEYGDLDEHVELTELHLGEVLDWLKRDPDLENDPDAYALTVIGDSMSPLFEPGTTVKVGPRHPAVIGDNVVIQLRGNGEDEDRITMVLIKRLVKRSTTYVELQQYNPAVTFRVPISKIALDSRGRPRIHKVVSAHF